MSTLLNLIELKNFIDKNPTFNSTKWHKKLSIRYIDVLVLKQNKMVVNKGSAKNPNWAWVAPIPNMVMADELRKRVKKTMDEQMRRRKLNKLNQAEEVKPVEAEPSPRLKRSFLSVLEDVDIRINDHVTARVNVKKAVISKGSFSMEVTDPEVFNNIVKLLR